MTRRLLLLLLSAVVLVVLWRRTGFAELGRTLAHLEPGWLAAAFALFVPQSLLSALRWRWIVGYYQPLALRRAAGLVLAASSLNVLLPSKLGDVLKGARLDPALPGGDLRTGLLLGLLEKGLDTAALCAVMVAASTLAPPTNALGWFLYVAGAVGVLGFVVLACGPVARRLAVLAHSTRGGPLGKAVRLLGSAAEILARAGTKPARLAAIVGAALLLWTLHVLQFDFVHRAAGGTAPTALVWSRVPMAILLGLLPVTVAGIGTRDAALVYFLGGASGEGAALALGVLGTVRYLVPALLGLPFLAGVGGLPSRGRAPTAPRP